MTGQEKPQRKRATRAERYARLKAQVLEMEAQDKKAKKAEDWKNIRVMAYAMASLLHLYKNVDTDDTGYGKLMHSAQICLNARDRARLIAAVSQLGMPTAKLSLDRQVPLDLRDCGWCRSAVMKATVPSDEVSPPSPPAPPAGAGGETTSSNKKSTYENALTGMARKVGA